MTGSQFRNSVATLFGRPIEVAAALPDDRLAQFRATLAGRAAINAGLLDAYVQAAYGVAARVFSDPASRAATTGCAPGGAPDRSCVEAYLGRLTRLAFRGPVPAEELGRYVDGALASAARFEDAWRGLEEATAAVLLSPRFLLRLETSDPDPGTPGRFRLDGPSMASRLAFFLLDSTPDESLLRAGAEGALSTAEGVRAMAVKLLDDARGAKTVARFLGELLDVDDLASLQKDSTIFPAVTAALTETLARSTEQFIEQLALARGGDLSALLTSRDVFVDAALARLYGIGAPAGGNLSKVTLPAGSPRAGFLGQVAFLAHHAGQTETSPTHRGLAIRRGLLCQEIPEPPAGLNPVLPTPPAGQVWTTRERSEALLATNPCGSCHQSMDRLGFAFEGFDAAGVVRATDAGKPVDTRTDLDGTPVSSPADVGVVVARDPRYASCMVSQLFRFATGRSAESPSDRAVVEGLAQGLVREGLLLGKLLPAFAASDLFRRSAGVL